jgi:dTDP-4-dehydrorhamnose reductase
LRILVTGASGGLGAYLIERLVDQGRDVIAWSGSGVGDRSGVPLRPIDLTDGEAIFRALNKAEPDAIVHLAAISSAAACLDDPARAAKVNVEATSRLAEWCARNDRRLIYASTDLVFAGSRSWNRETDPAAPLMLYGLTKVVGESPVAAIPGGLIARMSLMFGPSRSGRPGFFDAAIGDIRGGRSRTFFDDEYRTPLDYATAASILARLIETDIAGVLHVAGPERMSRYDLMVRVAVAMGLDPSLVRPGKQSDVPSPEPRPADVSLATEKLVELFPDLIRSSIEEVASAWRLSGDL